MVINDQHGQRSDEKIVKTLGALIGREADM